MADSSRWERFPLRAGDVVVTTPSKCGTTWMQHIVGMMLLDRVDLGVPIGTVSPWLDMLIRSEDEVFSLLHAQEHRRFIKTHTPLDGLPDDPRVTYIVVIRHPLDVALSDLDHDLNGVDGRAWAMRREAVGEPDPAARLPADWEPPPQGADPRERLLWFISNRNQPRGSGPYGLADYCHQVGTYWQARERPAVHLFHYQDLWGDLDGEVSRVADVLGVELGPARRSDLVRAARLDALRARADRAAPEADKGLWKSPAAFFARGGRRDWESLLTRAERADFESRLDALAGEAASWVRLGRAGLSR